ncbi:MAG: ABC transporter permease [Aquihabitans sp.]
MTDLIPDPLAGTAQAPPLGADIEEVESSPRKRMPVGAWLSGAWLSVVLFLALFADFLPLQDPAAEVARPELAPGQDGFIFGADGNGRDMFSRLVYGGRNSLAIAVFSILIGFVIGGLLGLFSGYFRNWIGQTLSTLFDILLAIPAVVLAMALVAVLKGDPTDKDAFHMSPILILIIALAIVAIPLLARITRANTMTWSQREFVSAARAQGAKDSRILFREILPNVLPAMVYIALLGMAIAIVAEGSLAILGASVEPPTPTWGVMIVQGKADMETAPFIMFLPIVTVFATVMALNFLSDFIRDRFDVRESAL